MRYLKPINESIIDQIQQKKKMIWDNLGLSEFNETIDDILQMMELDFDFDYKSGYTDLDVEYKINVTRRKSVNMSTIQDWRPPSHSNSELDKVIRALENAISIEAKTERHIRFSLNKESSRWIIKMIRSLNSRCESESIDLEIRSNGNTLNIHLDSEEVIHIGSFHEISPEWIGRVDYITTGLDHQDNSGRLIYLKLNFVKNIPVDSIKISEDPFHELPQNVIDDFREFAKKYRISNQDKEHLLKIIDKGFEKRS